MTKERDSQVTGVEGAGVIATRTELNGERPAENAAVEERVPQPALSVHHARRPGKVAIRGKTKGLIRTFDAKTHRAIRRSIRQNGHVSDSTVRGRRMFWHRHLALLHTKHGLWISKVENIQWKHVVAIVRELRQTEYRAATKSVHFYYLVWGLIALEKRHLVQRVEEYLVEVGETLATRGLE